MKNPLDVGRQRPIKWTPDGAKKRREEFLRQCWCCKKDDAVDRNDSLGLCPSCVDRMRDIETTDATRREAA